MIDVLLVEDDPSDVLLARHALGENGRFRLTVASRLDEAGRLIQQSAFDVVLLDLGLPDSHGLGALHALLRLSPGTPMIVMTGRDDDRLALQAVQEGAQDYLLKGHVTPAMLERVIRYSIERCRSERALRESEARFRQMAEHIEEVFWLANADGSELLYVSPAYERMTGRSTARLLEQPATFLEGAAEDAGALPALLSSGNPFERTLRHADGSLRTLLVRTAPIRDARGDIYRIAGTIEDVTERRKVEERLRHSQKLEAIGHFAGGVAHDFNNLLTVINANSALLGSECAEGSAAGRLATEIRLAGERAAGLTQRLLTFSRKEVLAPRVLDLNAAVNDAASVLRRLLGEEVELVTVLDPGLGAVRADPGQIDQILWNLAVNARDAMPRGGRLVIETRDLAPVASDQDGPGRREARLTVTDTGVGMDDATKARIFEPFFTTKPAGTGLGLATVHGIVEQAGGRIGVRTEPGTGTTFEILLPTVRQAVSSAQAPAAQAMPRGTETILLVEDETAVRSISRRILERQGYTLLEAEDGATALEVAARHAAAIHLLVTDIVMPGAGGREIAELLCATRPGLKVLYVSGYTDDAILRHGVMRAETAFLGKPFTPLTLSRKVREVLDA